MIKCPSCDWIEILDKVYWCELCGARLFSNCPKCNKSISMETDSSWCVECGEPFPERPNLIDQTIKQKTTDPTKCPFCAGEIEPNVLKCKHCGEWLDKEHRKKEENVKQAQVNTGNAAKLILGFIGISLLLSALFRMCNQ